MNNIAPISEKSTVEVMDDAQRAGVIGAAHRYLSAELCAFPAIRKNKAPLESWEPYQNKRPTKEELDTLYRKSPRLDAVCILTGVISGGLEMWDFDHKGAAFEAWKKRVADEPGGAELLGRIPFETSQSGGIHGYTRCPALIPTNSKMPPFPGNLKLAYYKASPEEEAEHIQIEERKGAEQGARARDKIARDGLYKTLIETRGEGGLSICAPTRGYTMIQGNLESVPAITPEEREILIVAAYFLNEEPLDLLSIARGRTSRQGDRMRPGDDYNSRDDAEEKTLALLLENGWSECGRSRYRDADCTQLTRPGKDGGVSASLFGNGAFYVFSTNADPFDGGKAYSPFMILALLQYDGDCSAAAEALRKEGYGEKLEVGRPKIPVDQIARDFLQEQYRIPCSDAPGLRLYRGAWYQHRRECWREIKLDDLKSYITAFLQSQGQTTSTNLVNNVLRSLDSVSVCTLPSDKYEMPCWISSGESAAGMLPMQNGVLSVEAAATAFGDMFGLMEPAEALRPHCADLFITYGLEYAFDPAATCPKWEKYLREVQPKDEKRRILRMLAGLLLTPDTRYNVAFILNGEAGTGKSVFLETMQALLGEKNYCAVPYSKLGNRFGLAPLTTCLANIVDEMGTTTERGDLRLIEEVLKKASDGAVLDVERKGVDGWSAPARARMLFSTNVLPHFSDRSNGVWERLRIIPFEQVIRGTQKQNKNLKAELTKELPGILNWALRGLAELQGMTMFPECPDGERMKEELRMSCDHERDFLTEATEQGGSVLSDELYREYQQWANANGFRPVGNNKFPAAVKAFYPKSVRGKEGGRDSTNYGKHVWFGVRFREDYQKMAIRQI